ncbi:MAG: DNA repair protein RecN [Calditrichaeota bacterium]|nr:MAG: DNA repair protein RecN [Calditrichota bacterium]
MLKSLYIKNYALLEEEKIEFSEGLNIITGETGAGKSIILGALSLILGERVKPESIRSGKDFAIVEAEFVDGSDRILIRREINGKSNNKISINKRTVTLVELKKFSSYLIDSHTQHEQHTLLNPENHINSVDEFGDLNSLVQRTKYSFQKIAELRQKLIRIKAKQADFQQKKELYHYQFEELMNAELFLNEDEQIEKELRLLQNAIKIKKMTFAICNHLFESENSIFEQLQLQSKAMSELGTFVEEVNKYSADIESALTSISETSHFLSKISENVEFNDERFESLQERQIILDSLKKKYKTDLNGLLEKIAKLQTELELELSFEKEFKETVKQYEIEKSNYSTLASKLSESRRKLVSKIEFMVTKVLARIGMEKSQFKILVNRYENPKGIAEIDGVKFLSKESGIDEVEFYISTNIGENLKPLAKIASGGEISRIMLALKTVIAKASLTPTLVFDEVDLGISGKIALAVGKTLANLGKKHQVICITHLPQIAAQGENHFAVRKEVIGKRTFTKVSMLNEKERIYEIAKLISGSKITETSLELSKSLLSDG